MNEQWKFKSLSPEDVMNKTREVSERLSAAYRCLENVALSEPYHEGARHIIADAEQVLAEIFCDVERVTQKETPTDRLSEGQ
jgi:hypothetical protein